MGKIIDGKALGLSIREEIKQSVKELKLKGIIPKLVVVLVGNDSASQVYVRNKEKGCLDVGIESQTYNFPSNIKEKELIVLIEKLNSDKAVHGVLVQLPLPKEIDEKKVLSKILPEKDVDGFHIENIGKLFRGETPLFLPCTPRGIMELILSTGISLEGKEAVVVGRSNIVGKPMAMLLLDANCTVTVCHSRTKDLGMVVRRGDVVVAAVGQARLISGDMIKQGAIVIDVGMNRIDGKLCGDVDFDSAKEKAAYITPVPGGVGPMTIAMLLKSVLESANRGMIAG
ncbi:bifunctional methylenetetrahydrofolate dehydrogenase/methenyltetrahydrofolate cyclohydrolase [candidate division WOR-1 bacterium RIFOXYC2_FULL_37_10]|uniref:Bifunctional protein FolD n=1 Tax=candidate division WOR-1 bacterium RIFOXYB2_FULL_37_13 TaxID=1802579 RepID=A0A1F4SEF7_UNCSA|nr:MAG: bifunctional methylenetetrahydrofolate dehydrogenase/methenyltetrahydrofolate cyclohydrolase [candidate division WOR-1 bacterium RIFOXYA2_FULL_37_7]OGC18812.1 MAG: bifunctional methylenetetrahydrofolate dehydrogenase/methenyltetrahydrofolate cyclohydrolase [candidate division WOR-1 bacterium RIFOXYB2_FULL_37_13]OGC32515.1 MAG: bifunctional methylenetetrahydrofolate dehydrogenase/methenyltetrahydrofolate cyclohydrolase [candidate division WOR-1 bacterium RIFOXYC2_FULL_37_10]